MLESMARGHMRVAEPLEFSAPALLLTRGVGHSPQWLFVKQDWGISLTQYK